MHINRIWMALEKKVGKVEIATVWQDALAFWEPLYVVSAVLTKYGKKNGNGG